MIETRHSFASRQQSVLEFRRRSSESRTHYLTLSWPIARPGIARLRSLRLRIVISMVLAILMNAAHPARAEVDALAVQRSIDRGVAYLKKSQTKRGGWPEHGSQSCGLTSLCVLALLTSGVPADDPQIISAMRYLRECEPAQTYSVALQTLVYCQLGSARDLGAIRRNVEWLVRYQIQTGSPERIGAWSYGPSSGSGDPSNAQFAILALGAAEERGIEVPQKTFELALDYWHRRQKPDGSWTYSELSGNSTGSMTSAGIASIIIARGRLSNQLMNANAEALSCCGADEEGTDRVAKALDWMAKAFTLQTNPGGDSMTFFYYIYALERVGRLSGRRFIGEHDWYREGAERILSLQDEFQGFWAGSGMAEDNRDVATSFALLFLSKGKRQVVIGKLDYGGGKSTEWNRHPDALRQLVRHVERDWGRDLTWQTVDAQQASVEDLLQTPVLVIGGSEPLRFSDELATRLGSYLDQGGCIFFDSDAGDGCGNLAAYRASVEALCRRWFPDSRLEKLPPDHPIWFAEHAVDPNLLVSKSAGSNAQGETNWIEGVQACCRTPVFYSSRSLSCRWGHGDRLFRRGDESARIKTEIEEGIRLGENIIAYATGRELKDKLERRTLIGGSVLEGAERGVLRLGSLSFDASGDQAKRALPNATTLIRQRVPMQVSSTPENVALNEDSLRDVGVLWIHGRESFTLDAQQQTVLRQYIERGGIVLANSICASDGFADSFRIEIQRVIPESRLEVMPPDHPAWTTSFGGFNLSQVTIRIPERGTVGQAIRRQIAPPRIEVGVLNEFASVFFSPLDLSCALESQNSIQCEGYSTDDAVKIIANLLLYSLNH